MNRVFKIVGAVFIFFTFLIFSGEEAYATEGFGLWGNNQFTNSSGVYQTVPIGYGMSCEQEWLSQTPQAGLPILLLGDETEWDKRSLLFL